LRKIQAARPRLCDHLAVAGSAQSAQDPRPAPDFAQPLLEGDVDSDPLAQFQDWFEQAREAGVREPEAVALATATPDGRPSVRMVLLKRAGPDGFVFFSNYESRKGGELAANPRAALMFHWDPLGRQVRIEGPVVQVSPEETAAYVRSRSRGSRLSAMASPQSRPLADREQLERRVRELRVRYEGGELPVPDNWGGFRVAPESYEFWQHRADRLHDRLHYTPAPGGGWTIERLAP
jgi:pyridoxamine 5'-phosphate oxidase